MQKVLTFLSGKKTFFVAFLLVVLGGLVHQGYIDETTYQMILSILVGAGLVTIKTGLTSTIKTEARRLTPEVQG